VVEFSTRYEYFNDNYTLNSDPRRIIIFTLSFIFATGFFAALQTGTFTDLYKTAIPLTATYNRILLYVQLQIRF